MMSNTETLHRASESLARAQQVSAETGESAALLSNVFEPCALCSDQVADEIIVDLDDQRQSLLRTRDRVNDDHFTKLLKLLSLSLV